MATPSMKKSIKTVYTWLNKFCSELEENLSETEIEKLEKQLEKFDFKLISDYSVKKLLRDIKDNIQYAVIKRERLEPILQDIAAVRCVGCTCNYEKCDLYKMLDDISTPFVMEEPNCPYACDLEYYNDEEKKSLEQIKEIVRQRKSVIKEFGRKVEYDDVKITSRDHGCSHEKCNAKSNNSKHKSKRKN